MPNQLFLRGFVPIITGVFRMSSLRRWHRSFRVCPCSPPAAKASAGPAPRVTRRLVAAAWDRVRAVRREPSGSGAGAATDWWSGYREGRAMRITWQTRMQPDEPFRTRRTLSFRTRNALGIYSPAPGRCRARSS